MTSHPLGLVLTIYVERKDVCIHEIINNNKKKKKKNQNAVLATNSSKLMKKNWYLKWVRPLLPDPSQKP